MAGGSDRFVARDRGRDSDGLIVWVPLRQQGHLLAIEWKTGWADATQ